LILVAAKSPGQNITVINNYSGADTSLVPEDYVLRNVTRQTYIINEYEPANRGTKNLLEQMITYGLKGYVDNSFLVDDGTALADTDPETFDEAAGAIVRNAIWIHDLPFSEAFSGFSSEVLDMVRGLNEVDDFVILKGRNDQFDRRRGSIGLYAFQEMVYQLKQAAIAEALRFVDRYMEEADQGEESDYVYLDPNEYNLTPEEENDPAGLSLDPDLIFKSSEPRRTRRSRRNDFSEEVVELLQENNRILAQYSSRFEDLQRQIDELRAEGNREIREEIADMRSMIEALSEEGERPRSTTFPTEYLVFEKNQYRLTELQKANLNPMVVELAKRPALKVLITGYADKSGNSEYNAFLSKKRAESVRDHMVSMGIDVSRMVLTYFGDTQSTLIGAADRRVEVSLFEP
jgi:outer membrane protein OmpA-like peptidoglycan-associated protein